MTGQKGKKRVLKQSTSSVASNPASADIAVKQTLAPAPAPQPVAANGAPASGDCHVKVAVGATQVPQPLSEMPQSVVSDVGKGPAVQTVINKRPAVTSAPAAASAAGSSQVNGNSYANGTAVPAARTPQTVGAAGPSALASREAIINKPAAAAVREATPTKPVVTATADAVLKPAPKPVLTAAPGTAVPAPKPAKKTTAKSPSFVLRGITFVLQAYTLPAYYCAGAAIGFITAVRTELGFKKRSIK